MPMRRDEQPEVVLRVGGGRGRFNVFASVGLVMALLKLKERFGGDAKYDRLPAEDDEEAALRLRRQDTDAATIDTTIPAATRARHVRKKGCCVCCGIDCTLFWKAVGIVFGLTVLYNGVKFALWMMKPTPTGLEGMPEYSTALGCLPDAAPHLFNGSTLAYTVAPAANGVHVFELRGGGVGTIFIAAAAPEATGVEYELTLRSSSPTLIAESDVRLPGAGAGASAMRVISPTITGAGCVRADVVLRVPRGLKTLRVSSHAPAHVKFAEGIEAVQGLQDLQVSLDAPSKLNLLVPSADVRAARLGLSIWLGWLVGGVSVAERTTLANSLGDGTIHADVSVLATTALPAGVPADAPATLVTFSGSGRTDLTLVGTGERRALAAQHAGRAGSETRLTYRGAGFAGPVVLDAKGGYSATGLQGGIETGAERWAGDRDGADRMEVRSAGWVGLYF